MPSDAAADAPRNGRANLGSVTIVAGASPAGEAPARVAGARVDIADERSAYFSTRLESQQEYARHARSAPRRLARPSPRHAEPVPRTRTRIRRDAGRCSRRRARGCAEPLAFGPVTSTFFVKGWLSYRHLVDACRRASAHARREQRFFYQIRKRAARLSLARSPRPMRLTHRMRDRTAPPTRRTRTHA